MQQELFIASYGTLQSGERNFKLLPKEEIEVVGMALTDEAIFEMYINPSISTSGQMTPSVCIVKNGHRLHVQMMRVTQAGLNVMDKIENVGVNYDRFPVKIKDFSSAEIYLKRDVLKGVIHSPHRFFCPETNSVRWCANP